MKMSALSVRSGVPVATIKFYLREGLMHAGRRTSATQADYDESHLQRLALVRALLGPAALSVATARTLLSAIDAPPESMHDLLGIAHTSGARSFQPPRDEDEVETARLVERAGWSDCGGENKAALAAALGAIRAAGFELSDERLDLYARAMNEIADVEVAEVPVDSIDAAVRYVALGSVLVEPLLLAMRRIAQEQASMRLFHDTRTDAVSAEGSASGG